MDRWLRVVVMTDKDFKDYEYLKEKLDNLTLYWQEVSILSTYCSLAERWAKENGWTSYRYSATKLEAIEKHPRGTKKRMVVHWKVKSLARELVRDATAVVVFWCCTTPLIQRVLDRAREKKLPIREFRV